MKYQYQIWVDYNNEKDNVIVETNTHLSTNWQVRALAIHGMRQKGVDLMNKDFQIEKFEEKLVNSDNN